MIDRSPSQPLSWQISGQCMRGGGFGHSERPLKARPQPKTNKRAGARADVQSKYWQTMLRSSMRRHEMKPAPSCYDWLSVNHLGFSLTPPPHPPFTFQERKIKYKMEKQNNKKKKKKWIESLLGLRCQSLYFFDLCWILVDSMWEWEVCKVSIPGANFECFEEWYSH